MNSTYSEDRVRQIVREETDDMRDDIKAIRGDIDDMRGDLDGIAISFEVIQDDIKLALQMLGDNLKVQGQVNGHETRLTSMESDNVIIKSTVALHSNRLNARDKFQKM